MKTLLSLFDYSGQWAAPFARNGWNVIQLDIKYGNDINDFKSVDDVFDWGIDDVHGIIAAPPCTDFSVSGAQYWPRKDADGTTAKAIELVYQVQRFANLFRPTDPDYDDVFFWAVENPVGRMGKLTGLDDPYYFHPYEFAGHLNPAPCIYEILEIIAEKKGVNVTQQEADFVIRWNAYTKKTGLWGEFNRSMTKKPVPVVKAAPQGSFTQRLGGKSDKTKELRSITPDGFAQAFYEANCNYKCYQ